MVNLTRFVRNFKDKASFNSNELESSVVKNNEGGNVMNFITSKAKWWNSAGCNSLEINQIRDDSGLFGSAYSHSIDQRQGVFAGMRKFLPQFLKIAASKGKLKSNLRFRYLAIGLLSMPILPFLWESSSAQTFEYRWLGTGTDKASIMYLSDKTLDSSNPYLMGRLNEKEPNRQIRAYLMWLVDNVSTSDHWPATDDVHMNATNIGSVSTDGSQTKVCSGETLLAKSISRDYGTWHFESGTLFKRDNDLIPRGNFRFWFCPKKSGIEKIKIGQYYTSFLNARGRRKLNPSWNDGQHSSDLKVTIIKIPPDKPDLKYFENDGFLRRIIGDDSQSYDDIHGRTVNNSKPGHDNVDSIRAVEEKWLANGRSVGSIIANVEEPREVVGRDDWGGLDRPLGDRLQYGTWYFSNNYQRFMFRPNAEAINRLLPGERVRSHATYSWVDPRCHACPNDVISSDTVRVEIVRAGVRMNWDDNLPWSDNEIGKLEYDATNPVTSVSGSSWLLLPSGGNHTVVASDTIATSNNGMPEVLQSTASTEDGFSTEFDSDYGKWLWKDDNSGFKFEPDWTAINLLGSGNSATTTLELKILKSGVEMYKTSVTVIVHGKSATLSIDDVTLAEGNGGGSTDFQFTVQLSPLTPLNQTFKVPVEFNHVTTDSADFVGSTPVGLIDSGMLDLDFGVSVTAKTITIQVSADDVKENEESFRLTLKEPTGNAADMGLITLNNTLGMSVGVGTIVDDDRAYVSIDDVSLDEGTGSGNTQFQFTVSLSPATAVNQVFTVPIAFAHVTTDNDDFVGDPTQTDFDVEFSATDTSKTVNVMVNQDEDGEILESFTLTLSEPTGAAKEMNLVTLSTAPGEDVGTGTIKNDDVKKLASIWLTGFDGEIVGDGISEQYSYQVARYEDRTPSGASVFITENKNGAVINSASPANFSPTQLNVSLYPEFTGSNAHIVKPNVNLEYGQWYARSNQHQTNCPIPGCYHALFVPNVTAINELEHGDVVTSTYTRRTWHEGYEENSLTVTIRADFGSNLIGFDYDSRKIELLESGSVELDVFLAEERVDPITIPYAVSLNESAKLNADFMPPSSGSLTIPAGETKGKILLSLVDDSIHEATESFTVSLSDGADFAITPALQKATVTIFDDDSPVIAEPGGTACSAVTKPASVNIPHTEAYWKVGVPEVDGEPIVYREADDPFDTQMGFRAPGTTTETPLNSHNTFYFGVYYADGTSENLGVPRYAPSATNFLQYRINQPGSFRGYLRYRIQPRNVADETWYQVGDPCEFYVWWTDASRPGISMSIEQEAVPEGNTFRVVATATPAPNRDIVVPFTLSDESRIEESQVYNIVIRSGQTSGHRDIQTKFIGDNQTADEVSATAEWRHTYWLDDTKKTASVTIEDHVKRIARFNSSDYEVFVDESGEANLIVKLDRTHTEDLDVEFRVDDGTAVESEDYTEPDPTHITIPAGSSEGTITIAIISDTGSPVVEESESFTVTLIETTNILPRDTNSVATVTILDNDRPAIVPSGQMKCHEVVKPAAVTTPNTEAYWKVGVPVVDGKPVVYQTASDRFDVRIGFRDPVTKMDSTPNTGANFNFSTYNIAGTVINAKIENAAQSTSNYVERTVGRPQDYTGYLSYRIIPITSNDATWYHVGEPCEFYVWWTDANRPGITLSIDEDFVIEGNRFKVVATATPAPNRDILVPISFSDTTRLADSPSGTIRIMSGETSGHMDILTKFISGDQTVDTITVSTEWRSNYWLDESVKSAEITISETTLPLLSISADGSVTEADNAMATFTVSSDRAGGAEVNYTVTESGDFLRPPDPANPSVIGHTHNMAQNATMEFTDRSEAGDGSGPFTHLLEIPLRDNDDLDTGPLSVTVTLNSDMDGTNYLLSTDTSATVTIIDDDSLPVLSFEADGNIVEFDEPNDTDTVKHIAFIITATASANPGTLENVRYIPSEIGNFIDDTNGNTPDMPTQTTLNFSESSGTFTATLEVPIDPDADKESTGSVSVKLLNAEGAAFHYKLSKDENKHTWTTTVYDNDIPELTIKSPADQFFEGEADNVVFTVTARFIVTGTMSVNFNVDEFSPTDLDTPLTSRTFVGSTFSSPVDLAFNGGKNASLSIPITNNTDPELDRVVRITLVAGGSAEYSVASVDLGGSADITVVDDDGTSLISISAPKSVKESDGTIEFTVSSLRDPESALVVGFALTEGEGDDYLSAAEEARTSETLTLVDGDNDGIYSKTITVNLTNDTTGEPTGMITLTLTENANNYRLRDATKTAMVMVYDDDVPEIHFADDAGGSSVLEAKGANAGFKVTASFLPSSPLTVHYTPVSANFLTAGSSGVQMSATLTFSDESTNGEGPFTANLEVPIDDDDTIETNGSVTVTLNIDEPANETYAVDAENNMATVEVWDDESQIVLTIDGPESVLESAGEAVFIVTARAPSNPGDDYDVVYLLSQNGNFLSSQYLASPDGRQTESLNFTASNDAYVANLTIDLDDDDIGEQTGSIKVMLALTTSGGADDYVLGDRIEHTVKAFDDDAPLIWIESVRDNVEAEAGAMSSFLLHSRSPVSVAIRYRVDESSFINSSNAGVRTTTVGFDDPAGSNQDYTKQIDIPLLNGNSVTDSTGEVTVTLLDSGVGNNSGYSVVTNDPEIPDSATVQIFNVNSGTPAANVASDRNSVTEGEEIVFNVSIFPAPQQDVQVNLRVSQQGNFVLWNMPDSVVVPPSGTMLKIPTIDTDAVENGMVTVEILDGQGYQPGTSKSVMVTDNDASIPKYSVASSVITAILLQIPSERNQQGNESLLPDISIRAVNLNVEEGDSAEFVISAEKDSTTRTTVNISLSQQGDFVNGLIQRTLVLDVGESEEVLVVETVDDDVAEADGKITATIEAGSGYRVASQNSAHVAVTDTKDRQVRKTQISSALQVLLPNMLAESTVGSLGIASERVTQAFSDHPATSIELNGQSSITTMLQSGGEMLNENSTDWRSIIDDSSFTVALYPEGGETSPATVWGFGDKRNLSGSSADGQPSWQGDIHTGHFGFDATIGPGILAGTAVSVSNAEFDYGGSGNSAMSIETLSTGLHPFMGFVTNDGSSKIQVMAGYGENELELKQERYSPEILIGNFRTFGFSGSKSFYFDDSFREGHNFELSLVGDAWHAQQSLNSETGLIDGLQVSARRFRIAMDGRHSYYFEDGGTINPSISIGLWGDGRNEKFESGIEASSGVKFESLSRLSVAGAGKTLLSNVNRVHSWEINSTLDYDSANDGKGILFTMSPSLSGVDNDGERYNWESELSGVSNISSNSPDGARLASEIGYGFEVLDGSAILTPIYSFEQSGALSKEFQVGTRFSTSNGINLELNSVRFVAESGTTDHAVNFSGTINW